MVLKPIESIEIMLQLAVNRRGVCALPLWLAKRACRRLPLKWLHLGEAGLHSELLGAFRDEDADLAYLQRFLQMSRQFKDEGISESISY